MPLDPESLIQMPKPLAATLRALNPLDPDVRMAAIEAVQRMLRRYPLSAADRAEILRIRNEVGGEEFADLAYYAKANPPAHFHRMEQAEVDARQRPSRFWIADSTDRMLLHRQFVAGEVGYRSPNALLRWLREHPQGATSAEVDLLASLHDELLSSGLSHEWARLLRAIAPDRARELAKTTPDRDVCSFLLSGTPEDHALFMSRFPNWAEEEAQREAEYLASLDDDDFP
jgi:hypothetical protein